MIVRSLADRSERPVSHDPRILKRVLLERGELPALTNLSRAVLRPGDRAPEHRHSAMWEIFYVLDGRGRIRVDGVTSTLTRDQCWVIEPGEAHEISNDAEADLVLLYFGLVDPAAGAGSTSARGCAT